VVFEHKYPFGLCIVKADIVFFVPEEVDELLFRPFSVLLFQKSDYAIGVFCTRLRRQKTIYEFEEIGVRWDGGEIGETGSYGRTPHGIQLLQFCENVIALHARVTMVVRF